LYLKNNVDQKIITRSIDWNFIADWFRYAYNSITFEGR
jgi:hypothetical protein